MPCRIGITTDPIRRRREWERRHPTLHNWQIYETYGSKSRAQADVIALARLYGCDFGIGGGGLEIATWYVYGFDY